MHGKELQKTENNTNNKHTQTHTPKIPPQTPAPQPPDSSPTFIAAESVEAGRLSFQTQPSSDGLSENVVDFHSQTVRKRWKVRGREEGREEIEGGEEVVEGATCCFSNLEQNIKSSLRTFSGGFGEHHSGAGGQCSASGQLELIRGACANGTDRAELCLPDCHQPPNNFAGLIMETMPKGISVRLLCDGQVAQWIRAQCVCKTRLL